MAKGGDYDNIFILLGVMGVKRFHPDVKAFA
jgi:hypothetical protein